MEEVQSISREQLEGKLSSEAPNNRAPDEGFALVNVLNPESFEQEHIPNSINIPTDNVEEFENRFSKDKEIVVYCASFDCDASPKAAGALMDKGFKNVFDYEGGMRDWKQGGNLAVGSQAGTH